MPDPYDWPFGGGPADPWALMLVGAQRLNPGVAMAGIQRALALGRGRARLVVHVHFAGVLRGMPGPGSEPARPLPGLEPAVGEAVCVSACWDAFAGSSVDQELRVRGIPNLAFAGVGLEIGVHSTIRGANDRGYECLLLRDACIPARADLEAAAHSMVHHSGGIFGATGDLDELEKATSVGPKTGGRR